MSLPGDDVVDLWFVLRPKVQPTISALSGLSFE